MFADKLVRIVIGLFIVLFVGIVGYQVIEGWSAFDSLYMTVITLASVGFMEVHDLSTTGRLFTIFLILGGGGLLVYSISAITAFVVEGELTDALRRRRMQNKIDKLKGHTIVCGADQTGRYIIEELTKINQTFVVIEADPERIKRLEANNILHIRGNATHDAVLLEAGIARAHGLIAALHSDADNLFVSLTAKVLNPQIRVISKAIEEESEPKLSRAGADGIVMSHRIGALRMVSEMLRPSVVTFLDVMLRFKDQTIRVDEITIPAHSPFVGKRLEQLNILGIEGVSVVALKDGENYTFNPSKETVLRTDDVLIMMGNVGLIQQIRDRVG